MAEHFHEKRFGANSQLPADRVRGGALLVLCAWVPFVIGGAIFAKFTEHWNMATPAAARWLPAASFDVVQGAAAVGAVVIALGVALVLPAFLRFLRGGGWVEVRSAVLRAAVVTTATVLMGAGVVIWAHHTGFVQRNGGSWTYSVVGFVWGLFIVATIFTWTGAAVRAVRRLDLESAVLRLEGLLALVLTVAMVAIIGGTATWWAAVAAHAPWFLADGPSGVAGSPVPPALVVAGLCMLVGIAVSLRGAGRVARALRLAADG